MIRPDRAGFCFAAVGRGFTPSLPAACLYVP
jgi:hypothetical protein